MQCFYHPEKPALGVCRSCGRGVCSQCAADVDGTLACRNRHEAKVQNLNDVTAGELAAYEARGTQAKGIVLMYALFGVLFLVFGILQRDIRVFTIPVAGLFLAVAAFTASSSRRVAV